MSPLRNPRHVTAEDLANPDRRERVMRLWTALAYTPHGQEHAWARLDDEQRCEFIALAFNATQIP